MPNKKYRLVTRSDFDGLVCAVLLKEIDLIDDILFVHPKDMQDGKIDVSDNDISTNLPYVQGIHLCFDHHYSETIRNVSHKNHIINPNAPSAARVVYDYYGGEKVFKNVSQDMMDAVDKADMAKFSREEILNPIGWTLLNFIMDSRTGLGRHHEFRISNYQLMMKLIDLCGKKSIDDVLKDPDVRERIELYMEHYVPSIEQLKRCSSVHDNLVLIDFLKEENIYAGNRFMIYALYPEVNVSMHVMWGRDKEIVVFAVGKSIINDTCKTNIGQLMLEYGGGGHIAAGTCQIPLADAKRVQNELIEIINKNG